MLFNIFARFPYLHLHKWHKIYTLW